MKKEDMKKPCREEMPALRKEPGSFNLLIFIILFYEEIFPQIPVNGFCKYNYFNADSGYSNFLMVNYNNDPYSDFILFNQDMKEMLELEGNEKGGFSKKKYFLSNEIHSAKQFSSRPSSPFIYTNRKKRKAGLFELNQTGKPSFRSYVTFDSYPEKISIADINKDGKNEVLITGGAFDGISVLFRSEEKLNEKNIISGVPFSHASFIDLNSDGYEDIAGYNLLTLSFDFFYNNSAGEFRKARSIYYNEKPSGLHAFDINLDSYEDLIFSSGKSLNIWYGDFRASYENNIKIKTDFVPDKFIYGDFNKDGMIDLAYLNREQSLVSVLFARNEFDYYPEIIYLKQPGLSDISPYYSRFVSGIAVLSGKGMLHTITKLTSFAETVNISVGAQPNAITFFDNDNNGITDFCFIDDYDKKIKFIIRNSTGIPEMFYSYQLNESHEKIITEYSGGSGFNYICFSYKKKIIESVKADFKKGSFRRSVLYSPGEILDLKVIRKDEKMMIYILFQNENYLNFGIFEYYGEKFNFSRSVVDNVIPFEAVLSINENITINYWVAEGEKLILLSKRIGVPEEIPLEKVSLKGTDSVKIISFSGDLLNMDRDVLFNFIDKGNKNFGVIVRDTSGLVLNWKDKHDEFRITSKNNLFFGEIRFNGLRKLSVYVPGKNAVSRLDFINKGRNVISTKLADTTGIGSFFIKNMTSKNYHIVYTDIESSCITIRKLKI